VLGRGSFGTVYLAEDAQQSGRRVALKSVTQKPRASGEQCTALDEARCEAKLLHGINHPNILRCHEWFEEKLAKGAGQRLWIVLELMDGGDLELLYKARQQALAPPLEAPFIRRIMSDVGKALEYIHAMGVLHRDVKSANVLLSHNCQRCVLADFGLACRVEDVPPEALAALGTPSYLPPEVICGRPHSQASDAWSLGVCTFKAAALQRPFEARDDTTLTMKIVKNEPTELPWSCAADVACAVLGLLTKDLQKRLRPGEAIKLTSESPISRLTCLGTKTAQQPPRLAAHLPVQLSRL